MGLSDIGWLTIVLVVLAVLLLLLIIVKRKLICIILKTMPRDFHGGFRAVRFGVALGILQLKGKSLCTVFDEMAKKYDKKICFHFEDQEWSFRQVYEMTNQVANYFQSKGFEKGDTVALFMENRVEYVGIWLGLAKIGVVPALINTNLRLHPLLHSIRAVDCKALIYGTELTSAVAEILGEESVVSLALYHSGSGSSNNQSPLSLDLDSELMVVSSNMPNVKNQPKFLDKLIYIYTSGTTGLPKAAVVKHGRYMMAALAIHYMIGISYKDIVYTTMPLYHSASGMLGIGQAILRGSTVVLRKKFSASNFWKDCITHKVTVAQYIGELCRYLLAQPERPEDQGHGVHTMFGNGLRADIWEQFVQRFNIKTICELYGSTEGTCNLANLDGKVGAVGFLPRWIYPISYMKLVKVDVDGEPVRNPKTGLLICCKIGEPGELVSVIYKGHPAREFEGYADASSAKKKIIHDVFRKGDSAFRSGDILVMDNYGYFYFKDRSGDTFRWKGENVSTMEVESVISGICNLSDAAVYGVAIPNTDGKAGMVAIADPNGSLDLELLAAEIAKQLPSYARPLFVRIMHQMDMTGTHKIKKHDLQVEGFDLSKVKDPMYMLSNGKYVVFDESAHQRLMSGDIRV